MDSLVEISVKVTQFIEKYNHNFSRNCSLHNLEFRKAGRGFWLCLLLPLMLCCNFKITHVSETYKTLSLVGVGQLFSSVCDIWYYGQDHSIISIPVVPIGYIFSSTVVSLLQVLILEHSVLYSICVAVGSSVFYHHVFKIILNMCPKSFTFGEATMASQALILYITSYLSNTLLFFPKRFRYCDITATYILQTGFFSVFTVMIICYWFPKRLQRTQVFLFALVTSFIFFVILLPFSIFRINSVMWLFKLVFSNVGSITLVGYWVLCCGFAVYCLMKQVENQEQATTSIRKSFHLAVFFVLLPGIFWRPCLMYFSSGIALAVLVMLEACRHLQLTEYWKVLQSCYEVFRDDKDEGKLALTPLYLMIGCVVPIWLYPVLYSNYVPLPILSGILSVAIGDTAASVIGSKFGETKWPGSSKTIEGTIGCFLSQVIALNVFLFCGIIQTKTTGTFFSSSIVIFVVSLVEARTDQIDNLVLPFISYILFFLLCEQT